MMRLPKEITSYITTFLSYEDKESICNIMSIENKTTKTIFRLKRIERMYTDYTYNPTNPLGFKGVGENWYIPYTYNAEYLKPRYVIQLCILRQYLNYVTDRKNCVYLYCPRCNQYIEMKLIITSWDSFKLDLYIYRKGGIKKTVCYCPCMIKGRVDRDEENIIGTRTFDNGEEIVNREYIQTQNNALMVQYGEKDSTMHGWDANSVNLSTWLSHMVLGYYGKVDTHKNMTKQEAGESLDKYMEDEEDSEDEDEDEDEDEEVTIVEQNLLF